MADDRTMTDHASGVTASQPGGGSSPQRGWIPPRFGLIRPKTGRQIAGVCAAIGQATGTDPVLWRVALAVLTLFGGIGAMVYLAGWLLVPEEGDEVSPVEGLLGRGRTATSASVTVLLAVAVVVLGVVAVAGDFGATVLLAAFVAGVVVLVSRNVRRRARGGMDAEPGTPPVPEPPSWPGASYRPPFAPRGPYAAGTTGDAPEAAEASVGDVATQPPPLAAPHHTDPLLAEAERLRSGGLYHAEPLPGSLHTDQSADRRGDTMVLPARPRRPRSVLGWATIWLTVLVLGIVAVLDVIGVGMTPSWYVATALATIGLGLLVGAWFGRARWLISLGAVLAPLLLVVTLLEGANLQNWQDGQYGGNIRWAPSSVTDVQPRYQHAFGNADLDLRRVDFTDQRREVAVVNSAGNATVLLPPDVDTTVHLTVTAGNATVFGSDYSGPRVSDQVVTDTGGDGPGGGELVLRLEVNAGNVEVKR